MAGGDEPLARPGRHRPPACSPGSARWRRLRCCSAAPCSAWRLAAARILPPLAAFDAYCARVAAFTLWQAALSTILRWLPAMWWHGHCRGIRPFRAGGCARLFALPFALPAIVAALGIWRSSAAPAFSPACFHPFGRELDGHLWPVGHSCRHVFNLPLSARMFLASFDTRERGGRGAMCGMSFPFLTTAVRNVSPNSPRTQFTLTGPTPGISHTSPSMRKPRTSAAWSRECARCT